jgi:NAD(P)-dependent dehydrogenase (short-subunit alcohol dehydrogenase family)
MQFYLLEYHSVRQNTKEARKVARLQDKVALITGGGGGIGAACAALFAGEGAKVAIVDIDADAGRSVEAAIRDAGGDAIFVQANVSAEEDVRNAVTAILNSYGRLHVLCNVAGGSAADDAPVHEVDLSLWDRTLSVDLLGTFLFCRHAVPPMIDGGGGSIVNTSSWAALRGFRKHVYVSAKGGLLSLTRALAAEYASAGIRANVICPGGVRSERNRRRYEEGGASDTPAARARADLIRRYPFGYGDPIDIANIALFLASAESRMITGAVIPADGGRSAY